MQEFRTIFLVCAFSLLFLTIRCDDDKGHPDWSNGLCATVFLKQKSIIIGFKAKSYKYKFSQSRKRAKNVKD